MASHPSPFHRQRQSNKSLDPTGQTAKFLYTILKQLDLKSIDWNEVAGSLNITNGHAARMRWSRFRAQIEGLDNSYSRKGGRKTNGDKKRKRDKNSGGVINVDGGSDNISISKKTKADGFSALKMEGTGNSDPRGDGYMLQGIDMKDEAVENVSVINGVTVHHPTMSTIVVPSTQTRTQVKQPMPPTFQRHLDPAFRPNATNRVKSSNVGINTQQMKQAYISPSVRNTAQWPQQYTNTNYLYPTYPENMSPLSYYSGSTLQTNAFLQPNIFAPPYQHGYGYNQQQQQQHPKSQFFTQPASNQRYNNYGSTFKLNPATESTMSQQVGSSLRGPVQNLTQPHTSTLRRPGYSPMMQSQSQSQSQSLAQNQPYAQASIPTGTTPIPTPAVSLPPTPTVTPAPQQSISPQALELASQASFPWPYSEASIPQYIQQAATSTSNSNSHSHSNSLNTPAIVALRHINCVESAAVNDIPSEVLSDELQSQSQPQIQSPNRVANAGPSVKLENEHENQNELDMDVQLGNDCTTSTLTNAKAGDTIVVMEDSYARNSTGMSGQDVDVDTDLGVGVMGKVKVESSL